MRRGEGGRAAEEELRARNVRGKGDRERLEETGGGEGQETVGGNRRHEKVKEGNRRQGKVREGNRKQGKGRQ